MHAVLGACVEVVLRVGLGGGQLSGVGDAGALGGATGAGPQIGISALVGVSAQDLVSRLLGKDVLDVNTEYDPTSNAVAAEVSKKLGKQITLAVKALSGREQQRYSAQFQFRLNDLLSFNGLWRRQQFTVGGLAEQPVDVYDFKLRYRMPLE